MAQSRHQALKQRIRTDFAGLPANTRGAFWLVLSALAFTGMTLLIKLLKAYPPPLQAFYSQLMGVLLLLPLIVRSGGRVLKVNGPWLMLARSLSGALGVMLGYHAVQSLPLAEANALSFTRALWIGPLAALVLKDRVKTGEWTALAIGFIGVLIIARPDASTGIGLAQGAAILSAFMLALSVTGIKLLTRRNSVATLLVGSAFVTILLMVVPAILVWRWPSAVDFGLLLALGGCSVMASATYIQGMSLGDATRMAPVDYVRMPFAIGAGFLVFHEIPGIWTLVGAAIIVATALWAAVGKDRTPPVEDPATPI